MSSVTLDHSRCYKKIAVQAGSPGRSIGALDRSHLDGFQKLRVVVEELEDPGEHARRRVLRREQHADDVVGDLVVRERRPGVVAVAHEGVQEVVVVAAAAQVAAPRTPPLRQDAAQYLAQPPPRLHEQEAVGDIVTKGSMRSISSTICFKKRPDRTYVYLDGLAVASEGDGDGEAVVAFLHDQVVLPELLLHVVGQPAAEDGDDADVEGELRRIE